MDHSEAVRLHAAEKYLLGELPKEQHAAYEEHYFVCLACAEELKATVAFMESGRQGVHDKNTQDLEDTRLAANVSLIDAWLNKLLRPAFVIPVFAALLLFIGYQNGVTIPHLKQTGAQARTAEVVPYFSLRPAERRGGPSSETIKIGAHDAFSLDVDMPNTSTDGYVCQILDQSGRARISVTVSPEQAKRYVQINVPAGVLDPGKYDFVVLNGPASPASPNATKPVAEESFSLEFVH
ncbi:MAG: hypothetical protein WB543_09230 [Candidatus Acidiferrum sp.]